MSHQPTKCEYVCNLISSRAYIHRRSAYYFFTKVRSSSEMKMLATNCFCRIHCWDKHFWRNFPVKVSALIFYDLWFGCINLSNAYRRTCYKLDELSNRTLGAKLRELLLTLTFLLCFVDIIVWVGLLLNLTAHSLCCYKTFIFH